MPHLYHYAAAAFVAALICTGGGNAFPAYDCTDEGDGVMAIDLLEPKPCPDPQRDYMPESKEYITLLQIADTVPITGHRCSIVYTKEVTRCGFNSITYGTTKAATERRYDLAPSECRHAVVTGEITVHGRNYQILALGQPQVYSFYTHGGVARDGSCKTENFLRTLPRLHHHRGDPRHGRPV
jgi:hypothetical protein